MIYGDIRALSEIVSRALLIGFRRSVDKLVHEFRRLLWGAHRRKDRDELLANNLLRGPCRKMYIEVVERSIAKTRHVDDRAVFPVELFGVECVVGRLKLRRQFRKCVVLAGERCIVF